MNKLYHFPICALIFVVLNIGTMAQSKDVSCDVLKIPGLIQADMERACPFINPISQLTDMERHNGLRKLGDEKYDQSDHFAAAQLYRSALGFVPESVVALNDLGWALYELDEIQEAFAYFSLSRSVRETSSGLAGFAKTGWMIDEITFDETDLAFEKATLIYPEYTWARLERGWLHFYDGDRKTAKRHFLAAFDGDPESASPHYALGYFDYSQQSYASALQYFSTAREFAPEWSEPHIMFVRTLRKLEKHTEAISAADEFIDSFPGLVSGHVEKGRALSRLGRYFSALAVYEFAAARGLKDSDLYFWWADALNYAGDNDTAILKIDEAIQQDQSDAENWELKALLLIETLDFVGAIEATKKSLYLGNDDPINLIYQAISHAHLNQLSEAEAAFVKARQDGAKDDNILWCMEHFLSAGHVNLVRKLRAKEL